MTPEERAEAGDLLSDLRSQEHEHNRTVIVRRIAEAKRDERERIAGMVAAYEFPDSLSLESLLFEIHRLIERTP